MTTHRLPYAAMQELRLDNISNQLLRDDLTANRYFELIALASTALDSAIKHADFERAQMFMALNSAAGERLTEKAAYQSAACFITASSAEIVAS